MVNMCVGQEHIVNHGLLHRERNILEHIHPLLHSIVHQYVLASHFKIVTTSGHFMVRANKNQFHTITLLISARTGLFSVCFDNSILLCYFIHGKGEFSENEKEFWNLSRI